MISLLSLNGLFLLMQEYNLEYPEFYPRLYALLTPEAFRARGRARFFQVGVCCILFHYYCSFSFIIILFCSPV